MRKRLAMLMASLFLIVGVVWADAPVVGQRYRLKNTMTGLYMQANGSSNLQLQGQKYSVLQFFSVEDAGDGKFYLKSESGANKYVNASGWNAIVSDEATTPFTIALVDGETDLYTLHQDVSVDYPGKIGADASTAGSPLYCNKVENENGKWQFEAVDNPVACTFDTDKTYRIRSQYSGLYMQVTNYTTSGITEGAFQLKDFSVVAEGQKFKFEVAEEGKFYLKTVKGETTYYVNVGNWNFHAGAEATTPFTIAQANGIPGVYSLHQTIGDNAKMHGYAGNDDALFADGTKIYCNSANLNGNTIWSFEEVVADPNNITESTNFDNSSYYKIAGERGFIFGADGVLKGTNVVSQTYNEADLNQHFAIIKHNDKYYLYNVGAKKFVVKSGNNTKLVDLPEQPITLEKTSDNNYVWSIKLNGTNKINLSSGWNAYGVYTDYNTEDEGNRWYIYKVGTFDNTEALDAFKVDVTVNYVLSSGTITKTTRVDVGSTFSVSNPSNYTTVTSCTAGSETLEETGGSYSFTVSEATTVTMNLEEALPFTVSQDFANATWHVMRIRPIRNSAEEFNWVSKTATEPYTFSKTCLTTNEALWAFVGNVVDGFKIYNKAAGENSTLGVNGSNVVVKEGDKTWTVGKCVEGGNLRGFYLYEGTENKYVHDYSSKLQIWNSSSAPTDGGSALIASPVYPVTLIFKLGETEEGRVEKFVEQGSEFTVANYIVPIQNRIIASCKVGDKNISNIGGLYALTVNEATTITVTLQEVDDSNIFALQSPTGTYFNFTPVTVQSNTTQATFQNTPSLLKKVAENSSFAFQSYDDENVYVGATDRWLVTKDKSLWNISEPTDGFVTITRSTNANERLGHDSNTNAGTGIFTNVGATCFGWKLVPAYSVTTIYKYDETEVDRVQTIVLAGETYAINTQNMDVASCTTNKGTIEHRAGYSIPAVCGETEVTVTLNSYDKYADSKPSFKDETSAIKDNNQYLKALVLDETTILTGATAPASVADMYVLLPEVALTRGSHNFTLTFPDANPTKGLAVTLWLDKDGDGTFETSLGTTGNANGNNSLSTISFTIPNDAPLGATRIRFRLDSAWGIASSADADANRMVYDIPVAIVNEIIPKTLTYNFMFNGKKIASQELTGTIGVSLPVPTYQFKVTNELLSFVLPEGKVEEGTSEYNVEVSIKDEDFPVPTTITGGQFANDTKWYFATLRNEYMQYNGSNEVVTTATHGLTDNDLFAVVGNPATGYYIYNKALGATKAIYSNTPNNLNSVLELNTAPNAGWSVTTNSNGGFSFYNTYNSTNYYLHEKDNHLKHWSSESAKTDGGSNLIFEPAYEFTVLIGEVPGSVDAEAKYRGQTTLVNNGKLLLPRVDFDLFTAKDISGYTWKYVVDEEQNTISLVYTEVIPEVNPTAVVNLLARVGSWDVVDKFKFVLDPSINSKQETFVIGSENGKILIKGSTISALTMGLGWYLNNIAHINIAWNSLNEKTVSGAPYADLSDLPIPTDEETHTSDAKYRYYLNTCTFGYSMTSWTWKRWQQEIDWMALHGINMPLQLVGLEEVWRKFLTMEDGNGKRKYGYTDAAAKAFVAGPAFIAWWAMNNLEGWGGTAAGSKSGYNNLAGAGGVQDDAWYARQKELAGKIVSAQRALGMQPVLPGWSGMVPTNFAAKSGYATRGNGGNWAGDFVRPLLLSVNNANYAEIAADYYTCLNEVMGESQYYSMDPFHEGGGAGTMADYEALYAAMEAAQPGSQWVIQQWQWSATQKYSLTAVPAGKLVVLDLFSDGSPAFDSYNGYAPQDAVFCAIPNFGGRSGLMGRLQNVTDNYFKFKGKYSSIKGIGTAPEAIEQTPVTYDLIYQLPWMGSKPDVAAWVDNYAYARYGKNNSIVKEAWSLLRQGPLNYGADGIQGPVEDVWAARPNLDANKASSWGKTMNDAIGTYTKERHQMLIDAVYKLIDQEDELALADGSVYKSNYLYDIVEFGGGVMADYAYYLLKGIKEAKEASNTALYEARRDAFLQLILDMDAFRGTNLNFRLGKWTQEARSAAAEVTGATTATADWYEYNNARTILTTWSSPGTNLNDYSYRSWQGLLKDFYYKRWKHYFDNNCKSAEYKFFEWNWAHGMTHNVGDASISTTALTVGQDGHTASYTRDAVGNTIEEANEMLGKYIIPVVKADGSVYYAYRYLTNDEMASKVVIVATAGGTLNLTEIFKVDLTGATVSGDFATMVNTFDDFRNVVVKSDATTGSHAGVITLTDGTVLKFNVVLAKFNGVYQINYQDNGDKAVFVGYNSDKDHANNVGYKLIAQGTYAPSADLDKLFTVTPSGAGYTLSAQGKYLKAPNLGAWNHVMFSDNKADAGVYLFEETSLGSDIYKFRNPSNADDIKYINDYDNLVFGNDKAAKENLSTFTLTEVTDFNVTFEDTLATINFPLNVVMPEGMTAYDITSDKLNYGSGSASAYAVLQPIAVAGEVLKAGTPAIVKMNAGTYNFQIRLNSNGAKTSLDGSILKGNFVKETLATSNEHKKFTLSDDKFTAIEAETEIAANNCWVQANVDVTNIELSKTNGEGEMVDSIVAVDDWMFKYETTANGIRLTDAVVPGSGELVIGSQYTVDGKNRNVVAISSDFLHGNQELTSVSFPATLTNLGFRDLELMFEGEYKGQPGDGVNDSGNQGKNTCWVFPDDPDSDPKAPYVVGQSGAWKLTLDVAIDTTATNYSFNNFGSAIVSTHQNSLADNYKGYMQIYLHKNLQNIVVKIDNADDRYKYNSVTLAANGDTIKAADGTDSVLVNTKFKFELEHDGSGGYQVVVYYQNGKSKMYNITASQGNLVNDFDRLYYSLPEGISVKVKFEKLLSKGLFVDCKKLQRIEVDPANPQFKSVDGVLYDKQGYYVMRIPEGETIHHYEIPSKVVKLYAGAVHGVSADIVLHSNPQIGVVEGHEQHVENAKFYLSLDDIDNTITENETGYGGARDFVSTNNNHYQAARYKRAELAEGRYGTICLPFVPKNAFDKYDFYKLKGGDGTSLTFSQVDQLEPNTAYLYKLKANPVDPADLEGDDVFGTDDSGNDVFETTDTFTVQTHAKYDPTTEKSGTSRALGAYVNHYIETKNYPNSSYYYYSSSDHMFFKVTKKLTYRPYRAIFVVNKENAQATTPARLNLIALDGSVTEIDPSLVEGMETPVYYDLSGRRVVNPTSGGIYIVNGKKVLVK